MRQNNNRKELIIKTINNFTLLSRAHNIFFSVNANDVMKITFSMFFTQELSCFFRLAHIQQLNDHLNMISLEKVLNSVPGVDTALTRLTKNGLVISTWHSNWKYLNLKDFW
jgi:hypothetical protein